MKHILVEVIVGSIYLAIIYTLVRPSSPSTAVIKALSNALIGVVQQTTGVT